MNFECDRNFVSGMGAMSMPWPLMILGVVSLTFCELSKIISRRYTMPEMTFMVRISSWNFVRVPKAWLWAHVQSFSLKFSLQVWFLQYTSFERIFWRARETLVKQPPGFEPMYWLRMTKRFDWHEHLLLIEICYYRAWVSNYTHVKKQDVIIRTCPWR